MSADSSQATEEISELSYEDARDELVGIVARIEGGSASLEESMTLWERGEALAAHCKAKLDQAQQQLDRTAPGAGDEGTGSQTGQAGDERTGSQTDQAVDEGTGSQADQAGDAIDEDDPADD